MKGLDNDLIHVYSLTQCPVHYMFSVNICQMSKFTFQLTHLD